MGKGVGLPRRQNVAIRLLFESGCAKTPSEAAVPALLGMVVDSFGVWRKRRFTGGGDVVQRKEEGR